MNKIVLGVVVVALIGAGLYMVTASQKKAEMEAKMQEEAKMLMEKEKMEMEKKALMEKAEMEAGDSMEKEDMMKKDESMSDGGDTMMDKKEEMMKGSYEAYSPEKLARAEKGDVVLFFHAGWCPSCKGLNADIEKNMGAIPEGVSILKVDYDSSTELKKKYGVTYQHTLVQVDAQGNLIKKWSGSPTTAKLVMEIQ